MWHGSVVTIPTGYVLCNGNNGTPDLRDRFIIGAGDSYDPGDTGGSLLHNHSFTGDGHTHELATGFGVGAGPTWSKTTTPSNATGTTNNSAAIPPYYALAYIMKT